MTRILSALTLALGLAIPASAWAQAAGPTPPRTFSTSPTGVNLVDTAFLQDVDDFSIGPLKLTRSYMSTVVRQNDYFGPQWTHNYDIWAQDMTIGGQASSIVMIGRVAHKYVAYSTTPGNPPENEDVGTSLTNVAGSMVFTDRDGTVYRFVSVGGNNPQKVSSITYPDGHVITFTYSSGRPKTIVSNKGFAIVFDYSGTSSRVVAACGFDLSQNYVTTSTTCTSAALKTSYTYGTANYLATATNPTGGLTQYGYDMAYTRGLNCIKSPGYSTCRISNVYASKADAMGVTVVKSQTLADGSVWQFDCSCGSGALGDPDNFYPVEWTKVTDPNGKTIDTLFTRGVQTHYWDERGKFYDLQMGPKPGYVTMPDGNRYEWWYNNNYVESGRKLIAKPGSGLADLNIDMATFPTSCTTITCNLPITKSDARGNVTDYSYDATHGGILSEMRPAPSSGAARPLKLYTYVQKYAYVKNAGGSLVAAATPIWMVATVTQCQTAAGSSSPVCDATGPRLQSTYEYGANGTADNLLVRGMVLTDLATGTARRACYSYDTFGRKISETSPRANLSVCP